MTVLEEAPAEVPAPNSAASLAALARSRQAQGDDKGAIASYTEALRLNPALHDAGRNLAMLLVQSGRGSESLKLWQTEMRLPEGESWFDHLISTTMREGKLSLAGEYASIFAALRWGSRWYPGPQADVDLPVPPEPPDASLSLPKLRHDIDQMQRLQREGILDAAFTPVIAAYQQTAARLAALGPDARMPLDEETRAGIGHVFNRIIHVRDTPRVSRALSASWDPGLAERNFLEEPPGIAVIDDFLSPEALDGLQRFCLESTIWSSSRHPHGRIGSQFQNGFTCPLLMQVAEELRDALPQVIGRQYPLRHAWGYKSPWRLPGDATIHADFAAVNVNFWITPDKANLDPESGGLVIYGVDAPSHWNFLMYNARLDEMIKPFLQRQQARAIKVPYRCNRAILFNSDLFHGTDEVNFRPGYENQRINITLLYGDREDDVHHPGLARPEMTPALAPGARAWRSAAFRRG